MVNIMYANRTDLAFCLTLHNGDAPREFRFGKGHVLIGRSASNDITVPDSRISSCHGQVVRRGDAFYYQDLKSTNGSLVEHDGERFVVHGRNTLEARLQPGDLLLLGDAADPITFSFHLTESAVAQTPAYDPGKTIVAEQAMVDFDMVMPEKLSSAQRLRVVFGFVKSLDAVETEEELYQALLKGVMKAFPAAGYGGCFSMGNLRDARGQVVCEEFREDWHLDCNLLLGPVLDRIRRHPTALLADTTSTGGALASLGSIIIAPITFQGRTQAAFAVASGPETGAFVPEDLELLTVLSSLAIGRLHQVRMLDDLRLTKRRLTGENAMLRQAARRGAASFDIMGESPAISRVMAQINQVAATDIPVLILGETGTGKELVARAVHTRSPRAEQHFGAVNCGAIPEPLLESELFGHMKGAFTGAVETKKGLFEAATGGTLFLDEIGEMPLLLQVKLLRALEAREIMPVGATHPVPIDVRIVCATNSNLDTQVRERKFREDLFYRNNSFTVELPPLRQRGDDIILLAKHFLKDFAADMGRGIPRIGDETAQVLKTYDWPGNVRQLRNEMQRATLMVDDASVMEVRHLSPAIAAGISGARTDTADLPDFSDEVTLKDIMEQYEIRVIIKLLEECGWNKSEAARRLGISRQAFMAKLSKHSISKP